MGSYLLGAAVFLVLLMGGLAVVGRVWRSYTRTVAPSRGVMLDLLSSSLLGLGIVLALAALAFWWWINGNYQRRIWIISGPPPYDQFGSGPLQLWIGLILAASGLGLFALGVFLRKPRQRP